MRKNEGEATGASGVERVGEIRQREPGKVALDSDQRSRKAVNSEIRRHFTAIHPIFCPGELSEVEASGYAFSHGNVCIGGYMSSDKGWLPYPAVLGEGAILGAVNVGDREVDPILWDFY